MGKSRNTEIRNVELAQETPKMGPAASGAAARGDSAVTMQYRQQQGGPMHQTLPSVLGHLWGKKDPLGSPKHSQSAKPMAAPKVPVSQSLRAET